MNSEETPNLIVPKSASKLPYFIIALLTATTVVLVTLFAILFIKFRDLENKIVETSTSGTEAGTLPSTITPAAEVAELAEEPVQEEGPLVKYVNKKLGFSMSIPKTAVNPEGGCNWVEDGEEASYRPKVDFVPVTTFENTNSAYITFAYSYKLTDRLNKDGSSYFKGCEKVANTLEQLEKERRTWNIISETVKNDAELEAFIKQRFGATCKLGNKTATAQDGVFSVAVLGDGQDMEFSKCVLNYMYIIKYAPTLQKVFTFDRGQSYAFASALDFSEVYDEDMQESFRVIFP